MKLSPLHYVKQSPQGCVEMRSSSWSPSSCLNGEGPRTIAAFYLTRLIRQPRIFWNLLVHLVINKAEEIQKMSNGKRERERGNFKVSATVWHAYLYTSSCRRRLILMIRRHWRELFGGPAVRRDYLTLLMIHQRLAVIHHCVKAQLGFGPPGLW